jgi:hypothetical protein
MLRFLKYTLLFITGAVLYYAVEVAFRGYSFFSMAVCGGICFILCDLINEKTRRCMPLVLQMLIASLEITLIEFIAGVILNICLGLDMWDYSNMPGNVLGQICPEFSLIWYFMSFIGIYLGDLIRWALFGEEKPHYHIFGKKKGEK